MVQGATSSSTGEYIFAPVRIGTYSVAAEFQGFQRVDHAHVTVDVQQRVVVDFVLPTGEMTQTVSVTAEAPLLQSIWRPSNTATLCNLQTISPKTLDANR